MRRSPFALAPVLFALVLAPSCSKELAETAPAAPTPPPTTVAPAPGADGGTFYVAADAIPVDTVLAPPPATGSSEDAADLAPMLDLQAHRTAQDCARAATEVTISLENFFGTPYGPLSEAEVQRLQPFFGRIQSDAEFFAHELKARWKRPRPWIEDARITPCLPHENSKSYPSTHATVSRVFARVLDQIDPARRALFDARADQIAYDRVMGGVHHPLDIEAGKKLGDEIFEDMQLSARYKLDLEAAVRSQ